MPTLHPRTLVVGNAACDIGEAIAKAVGDYDLTHAELAKILASEIGQWSIYAIRNERHPEDPDKRGDET